MADPAKEKHDVDIKWGVKIPMRDGVHVNATLYLPRNMKAARPAIVSITPYIADSEYREAMAMAEYGYPYLAIDVRGRGNSEGEFAPFFTDPSDGHDIVEWVAQQPYCNGKVGTRGLSYVGFTQWAAVRGAPEHLATIVPAAPCWVGLDYPFRFNIFLTFQAQWWLSIWGNTLQIQLDSDSESWKKRHLAFLESGLPYTELDTFYGFECKPLREWMTHPHQSEYYDRANPTPEQFAGLTMPVLSLTGAYDGDQPGTIEFYRHHLKHAGDKANHYLVIGPWDHAAVHTPRAEFMGRKFGPDSVVDMKKLHADWYGWTMEDGEKPEFLKKKVAYYVMETEAWRYVDKLDDATDRYETLYLDSVVNPTDPFRSGMMAKEPAARAEPDHFVYDPRDLSVPRLEAAPASAKGMDERIAMSALSGKLIYHTDPFERDTEVTGFLRLTAWLSLDQPDTDFDVNISEIGLDGKRVYLASQPLRARYREGLRTEKLINTTEPLPYEFDRLFFLSRLIRRGCRLRVEIGPNHSIYWQKNYNSGKPVAEETMTDARTVTVRLFHDAEHPSALHVPIGRAED